MYFISKDDKGNTLAEFHVQDIKNANDVTLQPTSPPNIGSQWAVVNLTVWEGVFGYTAKLFLDERSFLNLYQGMSKILGIDIDRKNTFGKIQEIYNENADN